MIQARAKPTILILLRITSLALACWLVYKVVQVAEIDLAAQFRDSRKLLLFGGASLYGVLIAVTIVRWRLLLRVVEIHLTAWDLIRLTMIGLFWSIVIPGTVGGDLVKMAYVSRHARGKVPAAVLSIMLDRIMGMFGLFLVAAGAVLVSLPYLRHADRQIQVAAGFVGLCSLGGVVAVLVVQFREPLQRLPGVTHLLQLGERIAPAVVVRIIKRVTAALDQYREQPATVAGAVCLSIVGHTLFALMVFAIGRALHEEIVDMPQYFLAIQVANAVASVPITPAGIGGRDVILALFFNAAGAVREICGAIPVFITFAIFGWHLFVGGAFFLLWGRMAEPDLEMVAAEASEHG